MPAAYFPLDVNFFDHPKVVPLGDAAIRLHLSAIGYANRLMTDGHIAQYVPGRLIGNQLVGDVIVELLEAVLWHPAGEPCPRGHDETCPKLDGDGWRIHDFLDHNRSKAIRLESQESERDRKAAWRKRQRDAAVPRDTTVPGDAGRRHTGDVPETGNTETYTETETPSLPSSVGRDLAAVTGVNDPPAVDNPVNSRRREGKGRAPRTPRHPSDEFVVRRAREIRDDQGPDAARAYLRTVAENYGQASREDQLRRLEALMTPDERAQLRGSP